MLKFLKNWTLPIAMLVGAIGYPLFISLSFLTPYLIFTMLLLTFCKVSPRDLKPKPPFVVVIDSDWRSVGCLFVALSL